MNVAGNYGGSEFQFVRIEPAYITSSDVLSSAVKEADTYLSRRQIRKNKVVGQFASWDNSWKDEELVQGFAIYEYDNYPQTLSVEGFVEYNHNGTVLKESYVEKF